MPYRNVLLGVAASVAAAQQPVTNFTWPDLLGDHAAVEITNDTAAAETWQATISPQPVDSQTPPGLVVDPATPIEVAPKGTGTFHLRLADGATVTRGTDARYVLKLTRTPHGGTPHVERLLVLAGPQLRLVPQSQSVKYVLTASRAFPFQSWSLDGSLALANSVPTGTLTEFKDRPLGVISSSGSGSSADLSAVVKLGAVNGNETSSLPIAIDLPPLSSGKLAGALTLPDGQTRDVVVLTQDHFIYPLLLITAGVLLAFRVKRYVTRDRLLAVLKATLADAQSRLKAEDATFRRNVANTPLAGFEILSAWQQFLSAVESDIALVQLSGQPLDQSNAAFTGLSSRINNARTLPRDWSVFGVALRRLEAQRRLLPESADGLNVASPSALDAALRQLETGNALPTIDSLPTLSTRVDTAIAAVDTWLTAWARAERLKQIVSDTNRAAVGAVQVLLWESNTPTNVRAASDKIDELVARLTGAPAPEPSGVAQRESVRADHVVVLAPEATSIRRKDGLAQVVAIAVAVLGGMNGLVFGKPFGSIADYAAVLAWALTASIAVDLASLALDRITLPNAGRPTRS